jgi:signal transduction histidine kinase
MPQPPFQRDQIYQGGTITFRARGEARADEILLFFTVIDTGIGIKREDIPKLFGNFSQIDTKQNRGIEGTGLGLAITRNLCRLMGGDVTVESEYGKGSVFTARIPHSFTKMPGSGLPCCKSRRRRPLCRSL